MRGKAGEAPMWVEIVDGACWRRCDSVGSSGTMASLTFDTLRSPCLRRAGIEGVACAASRPRYHYCHTVLRTQPPTKVRAGGRIIPSYDRCVLSCRACPLVETLLLASQSGVVTMSGCR